MLLKITENFLHRQKPMIHFGKGTTIFTFADEPLKGVEVSAAMNKKGRSAHEPSPGAAAEPTKDDPHSDSPTTCVAHRNAARTANY